MPIYDYLCTEGHRFERMQSFSDNALTVCEVCGKPVHRVLHAPAVHFKGKGFYSTDYGRKGANGAKPDSGGGSESGSKEGAAASSGDSGSSSSSESKSSESKSSDSKGSDSKGSDSKSSGGESSSSKKSDSSKPAA
jgi:putative FmdB family regulatory protein